MIRKITALAIFVSTVYRATTPARWAVTLEQISEMIF
jgi:hypothetical protein